MQDEHFKFSNHLSIDLSSFLNYVIIFFLSILADNANALEYVSTAGPTCSITTTPTNTPTATAYIFTAATTVARHDRRRRAGRGEVANVRARVPQALRCGRCRRDVPQGGQLDGRHTTAQTTRTTMLFGFVVEVSYLVLLHVQL